MLKLLLGQTLPQADAAIFLDLHTTVTSVYGDLKASSKRVTVGDLLGHPRVVGLLTKYDSDPIWRLLKCPNCRRAVERNIKDPTPCSCGYNWSQERAYLANCAQNEREPGIVEHFIAFRKEQEKV
jgi:hypothetical protein